MTRDLIVHKAGPGISVQDLGRPGYLAYGVSRGGVADRLALYEGAALLGQSVDNAALEMAGAGGEFEATEDTRIALTGAPMRAAIDGRPIQWNASHFLPKGVRLTISGAETGCYGYLHLGGGLTTPRLLGARSAQLTAGLGAVHMQGERLPIGADPKPHAPAGFLQPENRCDGGILRVVANRQTRFFGTAQIDRFQTTVFRRDTRGNRMGVRLQGQGKGFQTEHGLSVLSEVIVPGDIQITGDGTPFVLLAECQTTGGYPRIGTVLPCDLPKVAQAAPGTRFEFRFVSLAEGAEAERAETTRRGRLAGSVKPLVRDPHDVGDLLSYQLIGGVTAGNDLEGDT